jgi:four helix bundle protein
MSHYKELLAYKKAFILAITIHTLTKEFPKEEKYSLTNQIRRCTRSVCANFAEAFRRRNYPEYFLSKLRDSDTENEETEVWLDFALAFHYISTEKHQELISLKTEVGKLIGDIIKNPGKYR